MNSLLKSTNFVHRRGWNVCFLLSVAFLFVIWICSSFLIEVKGYGYTFRAFHAHTFNSSIFVLPNKEKSGKGLSLWCRDLEDEIFWQVPRGMNRFMPRGTCQKISSSRSLHQRESPLPLFSLFGRTKMLLLNVCAWNALKVYP